MNDGFKPQTPQTIPDDKTAEDRLVDEMQSETTESTDSRRADGSVDDTMQNSTDVNGMMGQVDAHKQLGGDIFDPDQAFDADSQGLPAGTPGHPGIDDDTA